VINYTIPSNGNVKINVTNSFGVNVGKILNEQKSAGTYNFIYDASGLLPDIYYLTLATENYRKTIKMVLMKE